MLQKNLREKLMIPALYQHEYPTAALYWFPDSADSLDIASFIDG